MNHLSDEQIYSLAIKVATESDLSAEEENALKHVADCDACYRLLCCMMAMQDVAAHIGAFATDTVSATVDYSVQEKITAVLKLAVNAVNSVLEQIESGTNVWAFQKAPVALAGMRSARGCSAAIKKLTDTGNGKNFVAYDPVKKLLMIQLDMTDGTVLPQASLKLPDGRQIDIRFEKREDIFWAEVSGLENGDYEIFLKK
jgi:hypothetical protein